MEDPFLGKPGLGEIERDQVVGKGSDDVQRVVDYQRLTLVSVRNAGRRSCHHVQVLHVLGVDLVQRTEASIAVISRRHGPLAVGHGRNQMDVGQRTGNGILSVCGYSGCST